MYASCTTLKSVVNCLQTANDIENGPVYQETAGCSHTIALWNLQNSRHSTCTWLWTSDAGQRSRHKRHSRHTRCCCCSATGFRTHGILSHMLKVLPHLHISPYDAQKPCRQHPWVYAVQSHRTEMCHLRRLCRPVTCLPTLCLYRLCQGKPYPSASQRKESYLL